MEEIHRKECERAQKCDRALTQKTLDVSQSFPQKHPDGILVRAVSQSCSFQTHLGSLWNSRRHRPSGWLFKFGTTPSFKSSLSGERDRVRYPLSPQNLPRTPDLVLGRKHCRRGSQRTETNSNSRRKMQNISRIMRLIPAIIQAEVFWREEKVMTR